MNTFDNLLLKAQEINSSLPFISCLNTNQTKMWTRKQIFDLSNTLAAKFKTQGITNGDILAICAPSQENWIIYTLATWKLGAILLPIDPKLSQEELFFILNHAKPKLIGIEEKEIELIKSNSKIKTFQLNGARHPMTDLHHADLLNCNLENMTNEYLWEDQETALISYTSGTTSSPKGVQIPARALAFQANQLNLALPSEQGSKILSVCGLNHMLEFSGTFMCALANGNHIVFSHQIHPKKIIESIINENITRLIVVPHLLNLMKSVFIKLTQNTQSINDIKAHLVGFICGGAPLSPSIEDYYQSIGLPVYTGYGLTETAPVATVNTPSFHKYNTVGKPLPGTEIRISSPNNINEGEILIKGPQLMNGFLNNPEKTKDSIDAEGWFHTGDIGRLDDEGFLKITGRLKNMIALAGGKKVHTEEVEEVFIKSEIIKEICILPKFGKDQFEKVAAVIIVNDNVKNDTQLEALIQKELESLGQTLAPYKRPSAIFYYPETDFPKTSTLKVRRAIVQKWLNEID